ncbi:MAG: hypothetical protein WA948_09380 [Pontixanthobacter sp.]
MPYDPQAPSECERSYMYYFLYVGLAVSAILAIGTLTGLPSVVAAFCFIVAGLLAPVFLLANRFDDYFTAMVRTGCVWAMAVVAAWAAIVGLLNIGSMANIAGEMAVVGYDPASPYAFGIPAFMNEASTLAIFALLAFHQGAVFHHVIGTK